MRAFYPIFAALAIGTLLPGPVAAVQWTGVPSAMKTSHAMHGHGGFQSTLVGYGHSAYSEKSCMAPEYGMDDIGSNSNHWRSTLGDNVWAGYCEECGLLGRRTSRNSDCDQHTRGSGGSRLFSLFHWSQTADACVPTDACRTEEATESEQEAAPIASEPEVAPVESADRGNTRASAGSI